MRAPTLFRNLAMTAAWAALAGALGAQAATPQQSWQADWLLIDGPTNAQIPGAASGSGGGGTMTVDATMPKGSWVSGSMTLDFDPAVGALRSRTDVDAFVNQVGQPDSQAFQEFHFQSNNRLSFTDMLSVGAAGWGTLKVTIKVNGQIQHNAQLASPPYAWSIVDLRNDIQVNASLEGAGAGSLIQHIDSHFEGISDGRFSKSDVAPLDDQFALVVPWTSGTPLAFTFSYDESMAFDMQYLDGESVTFSGINAFGHTLELFASVYDGNGVLMDGVSVLSSEGIGYGALPPVPEPSSLLLMACGVVGLLASRRRLSDARAEAT